MNLFQRRAQPPVPTVVVKATRIYVLSGLCLLVSTALNLLLALHVLAPSGQPPVVLRGTFAEPTVATATPAAPAEGSSQVAKATKGNVAINHLHELQEIATSYQQFINAQLAEMVEQAAGGATPAQQQRYQLFNEQVAYGFALNLVARCSAVANPSNSSTRCQKLDEAFTVYDALARKVDAVFKPPTPPAPEASPSPSPASQPSRKT